MRKFIHSLFIALSLGLLFSEPYMLTADAAGHFDDTLNPMAIAKLPACIAGNSGSRATINDFSGTATWNGATGTGGGTGIASVYCDGGSWKIVAGGASGGGTTQAFVVNAPTTSSAGSYATGCSGSPGAATSVATNHNCLMFDDHWDGTGTSSPTTNLNLSNWYPGLAMCNGGAAENCGGFQDPNNFSPGAVFDIAYPFTEWTVSGANPSYNAVIYDGAYASVPAEGFLNGFQPLSRYSDGSLLLSTKFFFPQTPGGDTAGIANGASIICSNLAGGNCNDLNWIGAYITLGGMTGTNGFPLNVNNTNALIPPNGGLMQWRMRLDNGVLLGADGGQQCSAVGGGFSNSTNSNWEFGYLHNASGRGTGPQVPDASSIAYGLNQLANENGDGVGVNLGNAGDTYITTGDDGVGVGDTRNWHTYAVEWTGNATHQWHWYVDGIELGVMSHNEPNFPITVGWNCTIGQLITDNASRGSFHATWAMDGNGNAVNPGPFNMWISDVQVYKRPGT